MSFRAKLIGIMVTSGIVIVIVLTFFLAQHNSKILVDNTLESNNNLAAAISINIDNCLNELARTTKTLATAPIIKEHLAESNRALSHLSAAEIKDRIRILDKQWLAANSIDDEFIQGYLSNPVAELLEKQAEVIPDLYGEIFLTNRYGELIASTSKLTTFSHGEKYWWLEGYDSGQGKVFFDDRGYDTSVGDFVLGVVVPVHGEDQVSGILKSNMRIHSLFNDIINNYSPLYKPGDLKIARTDGQVVLEPNQQPFSTTIDDGLLPILEKAQLSTTYIGENNRDYLISVSPITKITALSKADFKSGGRSIDHVSGNTGEGWAVVLTVPKEIIDREIAAQTGQFLLIGVLSILLISLLTSLFVNSATRNIIKLVDLTAEVAQGNLNRQVSVRTNDEIGKLAGSFNHMLDRLKATMASKEELTREITKREEVEEKLKRLSTLDELTQIYNRRAFNDYLNKCIAYSRLYKKPLSLALIDIDYFKQINDSYGHGIGDEVLKKLSRILSQNIRKKDILSRWGGEEFTILMPGIPTAEAYKMAERLRKIVENTQLTKEISITISIGLTELKPSDTFDQVIQRADAAQYRAKAQGRNKVQIL